MSLVTAKALSVVSFKSLNIYNKSILALTLLFLLSILSFGFLGFNIEFNPISAALIILISLAFTIVVFKKRFQDQHLKTALLGFNFGFVVLVSGTQFLVQNENLLNCPKNAIHFIDNELKRVDNILVYNYLLASTKYYSNKNVVTLNNGHNTVQRETQFERDTDWKSKLIDLRTDLGKEKTKKFIQNNSVLLMRKQDRLEDELRFIEHAFNHKKEIGKWIVYY